MNKNLSIQKTIVLLVFLCAAVMTSFFVFHIRHQTPVQAPTENGVVFPVARDIKPFDLITADQKAFSQQNFLHHWTLLFFGFTHCASICPTTLETMKRAYQQIQNVYPNVQVVFITLDPERDHPDDLAQYMQKFNDNFIGVTGKIQTIRKLQGQLGIFSARDEASGSDYQLQHTSSILLINPQGKWAGMLRFGMQPQQFAEAFIASVNYLNKQTS